MFRFTRTAGLLTLCACLTAMVVLTGCNPPPDGEPEPAEVTPCNPPPDDEPEPAEVTPKKPELLVELDDKYNTPDGMTLLPDNSIILSVPNFNDTDDPACLLKITPENKVEHFYALPVHPETDKVGPLGVCAAPSGDLYVADCQLGNQNSRLLRVVVKDGKPVETVTVVSGFNVSNAVIIRDDYIYVTETQLDTSVKPMLGGIFRFKLGEEGIQLSTPPKDDPHLIATIKTFNEKIAFGADGLTFDDDGNLYCGNFADGTVHKIEFDDQGEVTSNKIFAKAECMKSSDGLFFDKKRQKIYVADSVANAVQAVSLTGEVETLAQNPDSNGADGELDQPCEILVRGDELIVSNMDWPVKDADTDEALTVNTEWNKPHTLSTIKLD